MARCLAVAISQAPGLRGMPVSATARAPRPGRPGRALRRCPTSRTIRASPAISRADSIRQTASIASWVSEVTSVGPRRSARISISARPPSPSATSNGQRRAHSTRVGRAIRTWRMQNAADDRRSVGRTGLRGSRVAGSLEAEARSPPGQVEPLGRRARPRPLEGRPRTPGSPRRTATFGRPSRDGAPERSIRKRMSCAHESRAARPSPPGGTARGAPSGRPRPPRRSG